MSKKTSRLVAYIIVPLIFTLIGTAVLFIGFLKPAEGLVRAYDRMVGKMPPVFDEEDVQKVVNSADIQRPMHGAYYANMYCERFSYFGKIYYGSTVRTLKKGITQWSQSSMPGFGGTIVLFADNEGSFWVLEDMERDDVIEIDTAYGRFGYRITEVKVGYEKDVLPVYDGNEMLVMYTGYPFDEEDAGNSENSDGTAQADVGGTHKIVWAQKVSGPVVEVREVQE